LATNMTNVSVALRAVQPVHGGPYVHGQRAANIRGLIHLIC
jgi:hypothetical protein